MMDMFTIPKWWVLDKALVNAGKAWNTHYNRAIRQWFYALPEGAQFTAEDMRKAVEASGLPPPHHRGAWGAKINGITRKWLAADLITIIGWKVVESSKTHTYPYKLYRKSI